VPGTSWYRVCFEDSELIFDLGSEHRNLFGEIGGKAIKEFYSPI
jgi:hypothetical protein